MQKLKFLFLPAALLFSGCTHSSEPAPQPLTMQNLTPAPPPQPKPAPTSGSVRGVIINLTHQDNKYCYDIRAIDTANGKLPSGKYCADKFYFSTGDTIYATIFEGFVTDMLLIESGNKARPKVKNRPTPKTLPKNNISKKILIDVPESENISFD